MTKKSETIAKAYDPATVETKWYAYWLKHEHFKSTINPERKSFSIVIPPPNVTGALHIGHAYNNAVQDIYTRFKRLQGFEVLWSPGTDHAGITTQTVVERLLQKEGKSREALGREQFTQEVWQHAIKYKKRILEQLQRMGCSLDWSKEWFTLDENLSQAVRAVFVSLYHKGWIYKGEYMVNWCPFSRSAISDEEVEYREIQGNLWHLKYPIAESTQFLVVATTRPETMLGDTAVAVHPEDERYRDLIGSKIVLPLTGREIPIIADEYVDREFGSGAVKITPAHDPNDFSMGQRHGLASINIMNTDATLNDNVPEPYRGLDRFEARRRVVEDLKRDGFLHKVDKHVTRVGYSQRGNEPIEPLISEQWFLKMDELAKPALQAVRDEQIRIHPAKWTKTYEHWMTNIRDWCISRQLWWGHRIPAYYNDNGQMFVAMSFEDAAREAGTDQLRQDEDVLDTWFSSWLVPFTSMGWPDHEDEMKYFYPTDLLVTGPDIIFFWVARMIMASLEFTGNIPFKTVYFNGIVRDVEGRKMSKSLGNGIDPLDIIDKYSADALRFTLIDMSAEGQDLFLSEDHFELGRNFCNKVWNAFRMLALQKESIVAAATHLPDRELIRELPDRWILSRLTRAIEGITKGLESYKLHEALHAVYHFFWTDYCDWYLELIKDRLYNADEATKIQTLSTALYVIDNILRLLHPIIPFITEEIWQTLETRKEGESIMLASWPAFDKTHIDEGAESEMELLKSIITSIRNIRAEMNVPVSKNVQVIAKTSQQESRNRIEKNSLYIRKLSRADKITFESGKQRPRLAASSVIDNVEIYIPLEGLIDLDLERKRITKETDRLEKQITSLDHKLMNSDFLAKAPEHVVEREKTKRTHFKQTLERLQSNLQQIKQ